MEFYKLVATGNDFIFLLNQEINNDKVIEICDRNNGIGADGVITISNDNEIKIYNSDGSKALICGNGLRCACKLKSLLDNNDEQTFYLDGKKVFSKMIDDNTAYVIFDNPIMIKYKENYLVNLINKHYVIISKNENV